jgi:16S rRNA G966 N2-methylase RsmD
VEADRGAAEVIAQNAEALGYAGRVEVRRGRVLEVLPRLPPGAFALAFVDPPYEEGPEGALVLLEAAVAPGGRVVAEHDARRPPAERYGALAVADRRHYGGTGISIYVRE